MTCGSRIKGQGGASLTSRERGQEGGLFCVVWSCWTDGIKSNQLATSTSLLHRSIIFRSTMFLLQLKMWFISCGATSHLGQRLSTFTDRTQGRV